VQLGVCRGTGGYIYVYLESHVLTLLLCVGSGCSLCVTSCGQLVCRVFVFKRSRWWVVTLGGVKRLAGGEV